MSNERGGHHWSLHRQRHLYPTWRFPVFYFFMLLKFQPLTLLWNFAGRSRGEEGQCGALLGGRRYFSRRVVAQRQIHATVTKV